MAIYRTSTGKQVDVDINKAKTDQRYWNLLNKEIKEQIVYQIINDPDRTVTISLQGRSYKKGEYPSAATTESAVVSDTNTSIYDLLAAGTSVPEPKDTSIYRFLPEIFSFLDESKTPTSGEDDLFTNLFDTPRQYTDSETYGIEGSRRSNDLFDDDFPVHTKPRPGSEFPTAQAWINSFPRSIRKMLHQWRQQDFGSRAQRETQEFLSDPPMRPGMRYTPSPKGPAKPALPVPADSGPVDEEGNLELPKPPREDSPFGPSPSPVFNNPQRDRQERLRELYSRMNYERIRKKELEEAERIRQQELEEAERIRQQELEEAARQKKEMDTLRFRVFENVLDHGVDSLSEEPISPGAGAGSGSNMGRFFRRIKQSAGRLYNAYKGHRPGRSKFQSPLYGNKLSKSVANRSASTVAAGGGAAGGGGAGAAAGGAAGGGAAGGGAAAGGAAALGPAAAVIGLGVAALEASKAVYSFARAQEETVRKLAEIGPQQAVAIAKLDVERTYRDIKTAQQTGASSLSLTDSISRFEEKLQPIESLLTNIANNVAGRGIDILTGILESYEPIVKILTDLYTFITGESVTNKLPETPFQQIDKIEQYLEKQNVPKWPQPRNAGN